jgi:type IV pilus assembly protein PilE
MRTTYTIMRNRHQGFTLIEVMIVVAIVAIITAVALPNYTEYIRRGHRAEVRANLLQLAQWMERAATANGAYPTTAKNAAAITSALNAANTKTNRYTISMASTASTFTLTATPKDAQVGDKCGNYTFNQAGVRGANGKVPTDSGYDVTCWGK